MDWPWHRDARSSAESAGESAAIPGSVDASASEIFGLAARTMRWRGSGTMTRGRLGWKPAMYRKLRTGTLNTGNRHLPGRVLLQPRHSIGAEGLLAEAGVRWFWKRSCVSPLQLADD